MKPHFHYYFFLADLDIVNKEHISSAGTFGYQQYTPLIDLEYLLYGKTKSSVPQSLSIRLDTGAVSPMVGVRALLQEIAKTHQVIIHPIMLGVRHIPYIDNMAADFPIQSYFVDLQPRCVHPDLSVSMPLADTDTLRRFATALNHKILSSEPGTIFVAECVPGGTLTASVLLQYVLRQPALLTPSSSNEDSILERRAVLIKRMHDSLRQPRVHSRVEANIMDYFQSLLIDLLHYNTLWQQKHDAIILGGGCQMLAPYLWAWDRANQPTRNVLESKVEIWTTPWVREAAPDLFNHPRVKYHAKVQHHAVDFKYARHPAWQRYAAGFAKEGCGFGGLTHFVNARLGHSPRYIVDLLDRALDAA
jgi:NaMN:DMB phosphoribosyltransferase